MPASKKARLFPIFSLGRKVMARKMPISKVAWVLSVLWVLMGPGGSTVRAEDDPGFQLVVVLDSVNLTQDSEMNSLLPQAASLLVHLLGDQDYLGLVVSGEPDGMLLPPAELSPKHRKQALDALARFTPAPDQLPLNEVMQQALSAFQAQGPKRRVLFWLAGGGEVLDPQNDGKPPPFEKIAAQALSAGVSICAALMAPDPAWQTLTAHTGGRVWEINPASDLHIPCLELYQYLAQPQEAPLDGTKICLDRWVKEAKLVMTRSEPQKGVVLTNPRKARLTKRTRAKNIHWVAGSSCDLITITRPRAGVWSFTGARPEACKIFLSTDLILSAAKTPREMAADETLSVTAALLQTKGTPAASGLLAGMEFSAELRVHDTLLTAELKTPPPDQSPELPAGARVGSFPPVHREGQGTLRLLARGKKFQRLRSLPLAITPPWYSVTLQAPDAPVKLPLHFKPDPERRLEQVEGTLTLKSTLGSLSGILINPAPGAEIIVERSPGSDNFCRADFHLDGTGPEGRPLDITSGPLRLETTQSPENPAPPVKPDSREEVQGKTSIPLTQKFMASWVWLALCAVGGGVLLASAVLLWRLRREAGDFEDEEDYGNSPAGVLRLKAQVESLAKEKGELEVALKEKTQQLNQLQAEKTELQADLERSKQKSQDFSKNMQDLERKLAETDEEAKRVKQEYMALYARNQREQETLKKN